MGVPLNTGGYTPPRYIRRLRDDAGLEIELKIDLDGKKTWRFTGKCGRAHDLNLAGMRALAAAITEQIAQHYDE